jgi:hypothetical protein
MGYYSSIKETNLTITFPAKESPNKVEDPILVALKEQAEARGLKLIDVNDDTSESNEEASDLFDILNSEFGDYPTINYCLAASLQDNVITFEPNEEGKLYELENELKRLGAHVASKNGTITGEVQRSGEENGDLERYYFEDNKLKIEGVVIMWANSKRPVNL